MREGEGAAAAAGSTRAAAGSARATAGSACEPGGPKRTGTLIALATAKRDSPFALASAFGSGLVSALVSALASTLVSGLLAALASTLASATLVSAFGSGLAAALDSGLASGLGSGLAATFGSGLLSGVSPASANIDVVRLVEACAILSLMRSRMRASRLAPLLPPMTTATR